MDNGHDQTPNPATQIDPEVAKIQDEIKALKRQQQLENLANARKIAKEKRDAEKAAAAARCTVEHGDWSGPHRREPVCPPAGKPVPVKPAKTASPPSPAPATPQPALAPPVAAGGRGLVPTHDEIGGMEYVYETMSRAQALPRNNPGPDGRPITAHEAMALMLKGWELGTKPIDSMTGLFISADGVIAQKADYMRSRIQASGIGILSPIALTEQKVVVRAVRYGVKGRADDVLEVDYTVAMLQQSGGLTESAKRNMRGTLLARATGQAARALFSDILAGACYTPEELESVTVSVPPPGPFHDGKPIESVQEKIAALPAEKREVAREVEAGRLTEAEAGAIARLSDKPQEKPAEAPAVATPAVAPTPAAPEAPGPRQLNVETFQAIGAGGVMQEMRTAGITKTILESILALAQRTPEAMVRTKELLVATGQPQLRYLTVDEGRSILHQLEFFLNGPPASIPNETSITQSLRTFVEEFNAKHGADLDLEVVKRWVAGSYEVKTVEELSMTQATQAMKEVRHAAKDPQTLNILLGQATP